MCAKCCRFKSTQTHALQVPEAQRKKVPCDWRKCCSMQVEVVQHVSLLVFTSRLMMMFKSTPLLVCAVSNVSMVRSNFCDAVEDKVQHQENKGESARRNGIIVQDWWCRWLVNWSRCQERLCFLFLDDRSGTQCGLLLLWPI